jgi:hypothetical protein
LRYRVLVKLYYYIHWLSWNIQESSVKMGTLCNNKEYMSFVEILFKYGDYTHIKDWFFFGFLQGVSKTLLLYTLAKLEHSRK